MSKIGWWSTGSLALLILLAGRAEALPGDSVGDVARWIQANPSMQPAPGETLVVRRTESPSRRFGFTASITAPGQVALSDRRDMIRSETISLFDTVYGVSQQRLEESLDIIYGPDLYQDYQQAEVVYQYPTPETLAKAEKLNRPLLRLSQGQVRQGDRFAYWVEVVQTPEGRAQNGQIMVLLLEDLPKLTAELEAR